MKGYHADGRKIIEPTKNTVVAIATFDVGAEIISKALNYYFGDTYTRNESVEMMHNNTATALKSIAKFVIKHEYDVEDIIEFLNETAEEMEAQASVVALRDELKFDKPK